jgi:hypothetical protein
LENILQELLLRPPVESPKSPVAPVPDPRPPPPYEADRGLDTVLPNRGFASLLSVDSYLLRANTPAIRPAQVESLSSIAAPIRPRLEASFFSGTPSLGVLPFLTQIGRVQPESCLRGSFTVATRGLTPQPCQEGVSTKIRRNLAECRSLVVNVLCYGAKTVRGNVISCIENLR